MNKQLFSAEHYTSDQIFALEKDKLFSDTWHFCGLAEDLSQANEYITVQAGNNNLIVYLNEHGELKALHNICRHRGMQLVEGKGKLKRISRAHIMTGHIIKTAHLNHCQN